ncbi:MAG: hypothetical protein HY748_15805 [Elusimicrobia bacterium]|nr:hypothetical protein [Elusimicrobiota bacterium]
MVKTSRQLQIELGHGDARSIDSYLARVKSFNPRDSIFYVEPSPVQPAPDAAPPALPSPLSEGQRPPTPPLLH